MSFLTCTHNVCFEQKKLKIFSMKFSFFFLKKKSLYIAWACFHNDFADTKQTAQEVIHKLLEEMTTQKNVGDQVISL